jgi:hypothetical protein
MFHGSIEPTQASDWYLDEIHPTTRIEIFYSTKKRKSIIYAEIVAQNPTLFKYWVCGRKKQ